MGVNSKAEAARARKSAVESERKDREAREKEDQYWRHAEGAKSRAAKKREEEAEKRAEAAAKKAEARRLAEQEEKELSKSLQKPDKKANRVSIPARTVDEALAKMTVVDNLPVPVDKHPEKRLKASFKIADK
nr:coiled-coil domain-containing protein 124 [Ipomoea batatas]